MNLPEEFSERMKRRFGEEEYAAFLAAFQEPPVKGLRVNPLKISAERFCAVSPFPLGEKIPWEKNGFYHGEERAGGDVYHFAGLYYLQEPSAMSAAPLLGVCEGERVLDLCAAPGGKTTRLAADLNGTGVLVANEIDGARAKILSQNVERMGITNCAVVSASPEKLAKSLPCYFDKILVDAPCSGEGMFRKEPEALSHWSEANVKLCAARQKEILASAFAMLREGGELVYSTCTFAEEETMERVIETDRDGTAELVCARYYYPHEVRGEGHFIALLKKKGGGTRGAKPFPVRRDRAAEEAFRAFAEDFFGTPPQGEISTLADGRMYLVPAGMPVLDAHVLRLGVELGEWDGRVFKPAHALAMAFGAQAKRQEHLSRAASLAYLRGETVPSDLADGWCAVCVEEFPLGLGKCVHGVIKNHLPKGLRAIK